ncbi:MAG: hypothetical protein IJX08_00440 [Clostridia bacterium]|nr:hypothetical protein [Clostridia bacterium]MBQ8398415.1 hypothetical protein [Clostridia bacterium]
MKKLLCLTLALLTLLSLCACSAANSMEAPEEESESPVFSSQREENQSVEAENTPSAPQESPAPTPVYPELPFAVDEICWGGDIIIEGTSGVTIGDVTFLDYDSGFYCNGAREDQPVAFFLSLNFIYAQTYHENIPVMLAQLENAEEHPEGITHEWLVNKVFDENGVYDTEKGAQWIRDLRYCAPVYENIMQIGEEASTAQMKADWKTRCASKGITCVDMGSDGLWIFCTRDQLASMVLKEEARFTLYRLSVPTQYLYSKEREHIVNS